MVFIAKILGFFAVIDSAVFPIVWFLRVDLSQTYVYITCYEGFCITIIGGYVLFSSLFSTIEQANDRYVGFGTVRPGIRFKKLTNKQKHDVRRRGILMGIIGLLLFIPTLMVILNTLD